MSNGAMKKVEREFPDGTWPPAPAPELPPAIEGWGWFWDGEAHAWNIGQIVGRRITADVTAFVWDPNTTHASVKLVTHGDVPPEVFAAVYAANYKFVKQKAQKVKP